MSDYDLAKAGFESLFAPVAELFRTIASPAAEEFGLAFRDRVRIFRFEQQLRLLQKTERILERSGLTPQRMPLRLLGAILENASWEENESIQDMWAALLANGAAGRHDEIIFPEILRQLSPADAFLLRDCFMEIVAVPKNYFFGTYLVPDSIKTWTDAVRKGKAEFPISPLSLENLTRLSLVKFSGPSVYGIGGNPRLTKIGFEFMRACEDPAFIQEAEREMEKDRVVAHAKARSTSQAAS
jgi:hypothetical protein